MKLFNLKVLVKDILVVMGLLAIVFGGAQLFLSESNVLEQFSKETEMIMDIQQTEQEKVEVAVDKALTTLVQKFNEVSKKQVLVVDENVLGKTVHLNKEGIYLAEDLEFELTLIQSILKVNNARINESFNVVKEYFGNLEAQKVSLQKQLDDVSELIINYDTIALSLLGDNEDYKNAITEQQQMINAIYKVSRTAKAEEFDKLLVDLSKIESRMITTDDVISKISSDYNIKKPTHDLPVF